MSSNFEKLFDTNTLEQILTFQQVVENIRKDKTTRKEKTTAIVQQIKYFTTMYAVGHQLGGDEPLHKSKTLSVKRLSDFTDNDVSYLFETLEIPHSTTKKSVLENFENIYDIIEYLEV